MQSQRWFSLTLLETEIFWPYVYFPLENQWGLYNDALCASWVMVLVFSVHLPAFTPLLCSFFALCVQLSDYCLKDYFDPTQCWFIFLLWGWGHTWQRRGLRYYSWWAQGTLWGAKEWTLVGQVQHKHSLRCTISSTLMCGLGLFYRTQRFCNNFWLTRFPST